MKNHKELLFIVVGILLLMMVVGFFVYSMNFLLKNTNLALNPDFTKTQTIVRFNLDGLKDLGIIK
jgi:hypothetical protein